MPILNLDRTKSSLPPARDPKGDRDWIWSGAAADAEKMRSQVKSLLEMTD
jgi:hypothetical protein